MPSADQRSDFVRSRLLLALLCFGWGTAFVSMRIALEDVPPFSMRVATLSLGALVMFTVAVIQRRRLAIPNLRTWGHVCAASLLNIVSFSVLTPFAQLAAETSRVAIIIYTMPIWAAMLARPILGERLSPTRLVALALCIAGMMILVAPLAALDIPIGIVLALAASVGWALGTIYLKWARLDGDPIALTLWQIVVALLVIVVCVPLVEGAPTWPSSLRTLAALVYSGVIGSGLCYLLWFGLVRRLPTTTAAIGVIASPVIGVIASVLVLGERPTLHDVVGFALMLTASAIVVMRPDAAKPVTGSSADRHRSRA